MIIKLIKPQKDITYDITEAVGTISWSGETLSAGRSAEITYVNAPYDSNINIPRIETGDYLSLTETDEIFFGQFFAIEKSSETGTITYTAYDMMKNLLESNGKYNFKNTTAEAITARVCKDINVPTGTLAVTGINIASLLANDKAFYDIIMAAYTKAHVINGKYYIGMIKNRVLNVFLADIFVSSFYLSDDINVSKASISETMDSIVNKVKIYDSKGNQIGQRLNADSISTYGIFQKNYVKEDGVNSITAADALLKTVPDQTISIEAVGDINCLSGYRVAVKDLATGLEGEYWIMSDKHTWSGGVHTMELELSFKQIMDVTEADSE